jgi:hypothetical protein
MHTTFVFSQGEIVIKMDDYERHTRLERERERDLPNDSRIARVVEEGQRWEDPST